MRRQKCCQLATFLASQQHLNETRLNETGQDAPPIVRLSEALSVFRAQNPTIGINEENRPPMPFQLSYKWFGNMPEIRMYYTYEPQLFTRFRYPLPG
jgi:hypothetical protein